MFALVILRGRGTWGLGPFGRLACGGGGGGGVLRRRGAGHMGRWESWAAGAHRSDQASVSPALYRGVTPPGRLVVSQQQHDDQHPLAPPPRADGGRDEGSRDAPRLCRPLLPRPEAQGAQAQVSCWIVIKDQ